MLSIFTVTMGNRLEVTMVFLLTVQLIRTTASQVWTIRANVQPARMVTHF